MKHIKRFCCKVSIATGAHFIGYFNIIEFLVLAGLLIGLALYAYLALLICPALCFRTFFMMLKNDCT